MIKKGTVGIRLKEVTLDPDEVPRNESAWRRIGKFEVAIKDSDKDTLSYSETRSITRDFWRLPTQQELAWYNQGKEGIWDKPKFVEGGIYVRTHENVTTIGAHIPFASKGTIVKAMKNANGCYYLAGTCSNNFREATPEECLAYEIGLRNIDTMGNSQQSSLPSLPTIFYMDIHDQKDKFLQIAKNSTMVCENGYTGHHRYYKFVLFSDKNRYSIVYSYSSAITLDSNIPIISIEEYIQLFNNPIKTKENGPDLHGENLQDNGTTISGRPCVSSRKEPAAVTSRLVGNKVRAYQRQTGIRSSKVMFNAQLSRDS